MLVAATLTWLCLRLHGSTTHSTTHTISMQLAKTLSQIDTPKHNNTKVSTSKTYQQTHTPSQKIASLRNKKLHNNLIHDNLSPLNACLPTCSPPTHPHNMLQSQPSPITLLKHTPKHPEKDLAIATTWTLQIPHTPPCTNNP